MTEIQFEIKNKIDEAIGKQIFDGLVEFNDSRAESSQQEDLMVAAHGYDGNLVGGIKAHTHRGWLYISQLWVSEGARGSGLGSKLMRLAEEEARKRGCFASYLNTFSFQAVEFYKKHGYEIFGELRDFPRGHSRIFLKKVFG